MLLFSARLTVSRDTSEGYSTWIASSDASSASQGIPLLPSDGVGDSGDSESRTLRHGQVHWRTEDEEARASADDRPELEVLADVVEVMRESVWGNVKL